MTLIARYPLQEDTNTTIYDVAGTNNGMATGATPNAAGPLGGSAWSFDGTDDYVSAPRGAFDSLTEGTISMWFNPNTVGSSSKALFGPQDGSTNSGRFFFLTIRPEQYLRVHIRTDADYSTDDLIAEGSTTIQAGNWYHVVFSVESGVGNAMYVNGSEEALTYSAGGAGTDVFLGDILGNSLHYPIGARMYQGSNALFLDGRIADLRVYDHALTASEAAYLTESYRRGTVTLGTKSFDTAATPGLSADYTLNGATAVVDVIGSPDTPQQEVQSVTLDGTASFDLTWNSSHTDFRIAVSLGDATSVAEAAPTITSLTLS